MAACSAPSTPAVSLDLANSRKPAVVLTGLSRADLRALQDASAASHGWTTLFRVSVAPADGPGALAISGEYTVSDGVVRFTPLLPFEGGRPYNVTFDPTAAPGGRLGHLQKITHVVSTPAPPRPPPVNVTAVYPSGPTVPANLLRMYIEFSGPMGSKPAEEFIRLADAKGNDLAGAMLPLDTDLWDGERRRYTLLFDPGRVKQGILPNRAMGRPLRPGDSFTLVVSRDWPDAYGQPLAAEFKKEYRVGPAIERPLDTKAWRVETPAAGSRDPLRLAFPSPLDHGLALRAITVLRGDATIAGDVTVEPGESGWRFTPREPWPAGDYALSILPALEDATGNRIGRAFEAKSPEDDTQQPPHKLPFSIR